MLALASLCKLRKSSTDELSAPAGLSFGKAVAAMLALKERSAPGCPGRDPMLRRQRELLLGIRLADVFGMQVRDERHIICPWHFAGF